MAEFPLEIVTPDGSMYCGNAESLLVRTEDGDVEILRGHTDFFSAVGTGRVRLIAEGKTRFASASGGLLSVDGGKVKLVCVTFEFAENIDEARAQAAKEKAEAALASAKDDKAIAIAKAKLARAVSRINVANMK
jgi:F-type H+-transporting ATPase subunit epsilon